MSFLRFAPRGGSWIAIARMTVLAIVTGISPALGQLSDIDFESSNRLTTQLFDEGKFREAIPSARVLVEGVKANHGETAHAYSRASLRLAVLLLFTDQFEEAEGIIRRCLVIDEKNHGPDSQFVADDLNNLSLLLRLTDRVSEAESAARRGLAINENLFGDSDSRVATSLGLLADLLKETNRPVEAELLLRRALQIGTRKTEFENGAAYDLMQLAELIQNTDSDEAEKMLRRALHIHEHLYGREHLVVATNLNLLARLLIKQKQLGQAERLLRRALAIDEKLVGPQHRHVSRDLSNIGELYQAKGQYREAEEHYSRALAIDQKVLGPKHPDVALRITSLAELRAEDNDWATAVELYRRAKPILIARRGAASDRFGSQNLLLLQSSESLRSAARASYRVGKGGTESRNETFDLAQWALQTGAADALTQMSLRFAKGEGSLPSLVRERQDLIARRQRELRRQDKASGEADASARISAQDAINAIDEKLDVLETRSTGSR